MAISVPTFIQPLAADHTRDAKIVVAEFTFDSSYPTGGEAIDIINQLGISDVYFVAIEQVTPLDTAYVVHYDRTNAKLVVDWVDTTVDGAALAEVADTTNLSGLKVRLFVYGLSS